MTNNIERQPKGRSTGGQFAKSKNPESTVDLTQESTPEEQKVAFKQRFKRKPRHSTADDEWSRFFRNSEGPEEQKVAFKQRGLRYPRHSTADDEWSRFFRNSEGDDLG